MIPRWLRLLGLSLLSIVSIAALLHLFSGFRGAQGVLPASSDGTQIPEGIIHSIQVEFSYNRTFGADPRLDNASNAAWESLT